MTETVDIHFNIIRKEEYYEGYVSIDEFVISSCTGDRPEVIWDTLMDSIYGDPLNDDVGELSRTFNALRR